MALTQTTLSAAVLGGSAPDTTITVASATNFAAGLFLKVDNEWMQILKTYTTGTTIPVLRGLDGTQITAHVTSAKVELYALSSDLANPAPQTTVLDPVFGPPRLKSSITTTGAWTPIDNTGATDELVFLNGTSVIALTIVNPGTGQDGKRVTFIGNGKAAHTITYTTTGFGNVGVTADVVTFKSDQSQMFEMMACGGFWVAATVIGGAATVAGVGIG
jgi:hypothetical protein